MLKTLACLTGTIALATFSFTAVAGGIEKIETTDYYLASGSSVATNNCVFDINIETQYPGEVVTFSINGEEITQLSDQNKKTHLYSVSSHYHDDITIHYSGHEYPLGKGKPFLSTGKFYDNLHNFYAVETNKEGMETRYIYQDGFIEPASKYHIPLKYMDTEVDGETTIKKYSYQYTDFCH